VVDIDHFKSVNDRHGHAAGDRALTHIARILTGTMRSTDRLFRYGGEEFVMLCPGLASAAALRLADRLRDQIARTPIDGVDAPSR
jgi:diguanylate cyclase (GGDEF)-like protein